LRFWNNEVYENLSGVLAMIDTTVSADRPPTPDPSPPRAGGGEVHQRAPRKERM
jgi:hypothetical protein